MGTSRDVHHLHKQYRRLQGELAQLGPIAVGTIIPRLIVQPDPEDKRTKKTYGPYYQWTYKQEGKTVTVNLTKAQAGAFQKAIHNHRRVHRILKKMLQLSRTILQRTTVGVPRRMRVPRGQNP
jgi:hypothetical protein